MKQIMKQMPMAHETIEMFQLNEAHDAGVSIARVVSDTIPNGRSLLSPWDAGLLAQMIINARHGDHVEIGTLFGGSAIVAALVKKRFGSRGKIWCVDPLRDEEDEGDHASGATATKAALIENLQHFGVDDMVEIVQEPSYPWPLPEKRFATGYVDGDHWNGMPAMDAFTMRQACSYAIMIDDYCMGKPEVHEAVVNMCGDPLWIPVHISGLSAIFRRRM